MPGQNRRARAINIYFFRPPGLRHFLMQLDETSSNICVKVPTDDSRGIIFDFDSEFSLFQVVFFRLSSPTDPIDFDIYFFPFQKKALVLVKARVSVGYDLGLMNMKADSKTKTFSISQPPQPQILSIDHDLSYYDISEGTFNSFSAEDYTKIQGKVKDFIRDKAEQSDLKQRAQTQGNQMLEVIRFMVEGAGWTMKIEQGSQEVKSGS